MSSIPRPWPLTLLLGLLGGAFPLAAAEHLPDSAELDKEYTKSIRPLMATYCIGCHGEAKQKGGVRLDTLGSRIDQRNVPTWTDARNVLDVAAMPPESAKQPSREEREHLLTWVAGSIQRFEADHLETGGDVLLRRINLRAYQNMVQTLTGVRPDITGFQRDGTLQHFDTAGSAIYLTQAELDLFFDSAQRAIADALVTRKNGIKPAGGGWNYKQQRQDRSKSDFEPLDKFIATHTDPAKFPTVRDKPPSDEWSVAGLEMNQRVIDPAICALYGKPSVAEVEKAGVDWKHDPKCLETVMGQVRAAVAAYRKRVGEINDYQPLWLGPVSSWEYRVEPTIETPGSYRVWSTMRTFAAGRPLPMKFELDGKTIESFLVDAPPDKPQEYSTSVYLSRGKHIFSICSTLPMGVEGATENDNFYGFVRAHFGVDSRFSPRNGDTFFDHFPPENELRGYGWRRAGEVTLQMKDFLFQGPLAANSGQTALDAALDGDPTAEPTRDNVERRLRSFMTRAYARDCDAQMAKPYVDVVMAHFERNKDFTQALSYGLASVLASPRFLYLEEAKRLDAGKRRPLEGHELARRLAYFLWSDLPDSELVAAAASGALRSDQTLVAQVRRMIKDPRSSAFRTAFTQQWLRIDHLDSIVISYALFPGYDSSLFESARHESVAFFSDILDHDLSVLDFVDSDFAVINNRMAMHYGIPDVIGPEFRRVVLPKDSHRGGLLGQASVLIATSNGMTSSLVRRGAFVMEQLLGMPPGVPPPNVPALNKIHDLSADGEPLTQSERLAQHRSIASCARCHDKIDPLGIGLENFDALGAWHDQLQLLITADGKQAWKGHTADVKGKLPGDEAYDGPDELRACLKKHPDRFMRRLAENLLIYALGRDLQQSDSPALDVICARVAKSGDGLSTLIEQLVLSDQFRDK
jgi:mono/diheme cytochrome c family protein